MGVRFRKSVSLGKGARINFSKSGASLSLGSRGASVSIGKRGVYSNVGIPGTGLSVRTRLDTPKKAKSQRSSTSSAREQSAQRVSPALLQHVQSDGSLALEIKVDECGDIEFSFSDTGEIIEDPQIIREIKRFQEVKEKITALQVEQQRVRRELQESFEQLSSDFIEIYRQAPVVVSEQSFKDEINRLTQKHYERRSFSRPRPCGEEIDRALHEEAVANVSGFFGRKRKIAEYEAANRDRVANDCVSAWENERDDFEAAENLRENEANERFAAEFLQERTALERASSCSPADAEQLVEEWLSILDIPAEIEAQISCDDGTLWVDLDLPEIEDLPSTTTKQLKSGQVKVVDKTKKQLKQEYATCVTGLAFFVASNSFNLSAAISEAVISGYTQRRNKEGDIVDDYVYSIRIPRSDLIGKRVDNPISAFDEFESRIKLGATFALSSIKPFEAM